MQNPPDRPALANRDALGAYLLPYFAYLGPGLLPAGMLSPPMDYGLRIVATAAALAWGWRRFPRLTGPGSPVASVGVGVAAGLAGTLLWVALKQPFVAATVPAWGEAAWAARLAASGLVVPVFEELAMRGLVLRLVLQWQEARAAGAEKPFEEALDRRSVKDVAPGAWSPLAVAVSTLAFMAMHDPATEWPAAAAYGALMAGLWIVRRDLLSCIVAHGVTNVVLACYVRATGAWALW